VTVGDRGSGRIGCDGLPACAAQKNGMAAIRCRPLPEFR